MLAVAIGTDRRIRDAFEPRLSMHAGGEFCGNFAVTFAARFGNVRFADL